MAFRENENLKNWVSIFLILVAFIVMRAPGLGSYLTVDEARWLQRSANFYYSIANSEWANTKQSPHPGVVTQWAGAAAYAWVFPKYAELGKANVQQVYLLGQMEENGINHMQIIAAGRFVLVLINAGVLLACWPFALKLLGRWPAAVGFALLAFDPFVVAHQRLLHLDGLISGLMFLSLLAYLHYLRHGKMSSLLISGIAAGFAWLTKTPSWFLGLFIVGLSVSLYLWNRKSFSPHITSIWRALIIWGSTAALVFVLFYPAMWSQPLVGVVEMIRFSLGQAGGQYGGFFFFDGVVYPGGDPGWLFYPISFLWRSTPVTVFGLAAAVLLLPRTIKKGVDIDEGTALRSIAILFVFSIAFAIFVSLSTKKVDRYLLPTHIPLIMIAGWGWTLLLDSFAFLKRFQWVGLTLLIGYQLAVGLPSFPYFLSYYNPLMGGSSKAPEVMQIGQGEGLEQAVNYLKIQGAEDVATYYNGTYNRLLFRRTITVIPARTQLSERQLKNMLEKEYIVIYILQWQRGLPRNLLEALSSYKPVFRAWNNGLEYARVYHLNPR